MTVLLGGRDAAMGPADQRLFKILFGAAFVVGVALLLLALLD
jgi:hypothetical protein